MNLIKKKVVVYSLLTIMLLTWSSCKTLTGSSKVGSGLEFKEALSKAVPGSTIIIKNGTYTDELFIIDVSGTTEKPITITAQTPGKVIFTGNSRLRIGGDNIIVDGLYFKDGSLGAMDGGVIEFRRHDENDVAIPSNNSILRNTVIAYYNNPERSVDYKWISIYGTNNIIEYNELIGKNHSGTALVVWRDDESAQYHKIRYNKIMYIEDDEDGNGAEAVRIGTSDNSLSDSFTTVEYNYFEQCNGEIEIISNKSGNNTYRGNTFVNNGGVLTLRHGDNCTIDNNFFFGNGYAETGGIRIIGENHVVTNNYIQDTAADNGKFIAAITLTNAIEDGPVNGYYQVKNAYVANNVLINNRRNFILGGGASSKLTMPPIDSTIENNIAITTDQTQDMIIEFDTPINMTYKNNQLFGSEIGIDYTDDQITTTEPKLQLIDGLLLPVGSTITERPIDPNNIGAAWVRNGDVENDPSFRKRNLFEESYQKVVILPWGNLSKWAGEKGIIVAGEDSSDIYINDRRYKFDIKDDKKTAIVKDGEFLMPKAFIEFQLGDAGETKYPEYVTLDEVAEKYNRNILFDKERGFVLIVTDKDTFDLLTPPRMSKKIGDLYRVIASRNDGNIPANTLDGQLGSRWSSDGYGEWLRFNLLGAKTFNSAELAFYKGNKRSTFFELQISDDKVNWTTIYNGQSSGETDKFEKFTFNEVTASYLKVIGHMNSSNTWNSIAEIQLYDKDNRPVMEYVSAKADVFQKKVIEQVVDIKLEGTAIPATDDAFVEIQTPDKAWGKASDKLRVKAKLDASIVRIAYIKFDLSTVTDINSAIFQISGKVSTTNPPNPKFVFDVYGIEDDSWDEATITWNNSPYHKAENTEVIGLDEGITHIGEFEMSGPGLIKKHIVDITEFVKIQKIKDGVVSLMLVDSRIQNGNTDPYSKERSDSDQHPYIFIK